MFKRFYELQEVSKEFTVKVWENLRKSFNEVEAKFNK